MEAQAAANDVDGRFADGIEDYVARFRAQPPAAGLAGIRLAGDMTADRFGGADADVRSFDTFICAPGREIGVRIHDPGGSGRRPGICYFHGGGFTLGSVESFAVASAALAEATGAVVASVQYRRLPESGYADAQADCDLAFAWLAQQAPLLGIDPERIAVAGDSAGALFALACAANSRDAGTARPAAMILFYGTFAMDPERPAYRTAADPLLTEARIRDYVALFTRCGGLDGRPAPLDRADLAGLPPTHVVAAEHDPLRSEAEQFAARLAAAGVTVTSRVAPGMIHGFLRAVRLSGAARSELDKAAEAVRPLLRPDRERPE